MTRPDLSALTDDALARIANRGLVKRAVRMQEIEPPTLSVSDGQMIARYPDGVETVLPQGDSFADASCTCGAGTLCRHRVGLVLAYRDQFGIAGDSLWSPAEFDDVALFEHFGAAVIARARKIERTGYIATVHRATASDPIVRVELPHCTVRFLVPHELAHAHSSASASTNAASIALAVWAVQAADHEGADRVHVGGMPLPRHDSIDAAQTLARTILVDGVANMSSVQRSAALRATQSVLAGSAVWLADACADLMDQLDAYSSRHARHSRIGVATVIAEIDARVRLGRTSGAVAAEALGTETPGETRLGRTRLIGLGAQVTGTGSKTCVDIYFAEADSGLVHAMRCDWTGESGEILTGHTVATRQVSGATVGALAASTVVTEAAVRRANHRIRLGRGGIGRTSVLPLSADAWGNSKIIVTDFAMERERLADRTPSFARERVVTGGVGAMHIESVVEKDYSPADQVLKVVVEDRYGNRAHVVSEHCAHAPGAVDAVFEAMSTEPNAVAGRFSVRGGMLQVTPFAIAYKRGVVVPDLEPPRTTAFLGRTEVQTDLLSSTLVVLADLSHRGLRYASESSAEALRRCAEQLRAIGMDSTGRAVDRVADGTAGELIEFADAWIDAVLRLTVAVELR